MLAQAKLGDSFMKSLNAKRAEKGDLSIDDIGAIFQDVAANLQSGDETEGMLQVEITKMADYINKAKGEIASITQKQEKEMPEGIADASVQLDAVVKSTENATNEIMDAADKIQEAAAGVGGDAEQKIMDASMKIYEACNFQDLTGQQINKVIGVISFLDERLNALMAIFTNAEEAAKLAAPVEAKSIDEIKDEDLLNGPQMEQPSQADIDALFDSVDTPKEG